MQCIIDCDKQKKMAESLGCTFCDDGVFAEMAMELSDYCEKTNPIKDIEFGFYHGDMNSLRDAVASVDTDWVQYFTDSTPVFVGYAEGKPISFCIISTNVDYILMTEGKRVGAIGCVGTIPQYRSRGIGLRMVDLATLYLKEEKCDIASISYTHIDKWYSKLGYQTFARFSFSAGA